MKHRCHCGLGEKLHKLKAGKLGLLGGMLLVLHLLFHVAECLILPALLIALHDETAEASEISEQEAIELNILSQPHNSVLHQDFWESLEACSLRSRTPTPTGILPD